MTHHVIYVPGLNDHRSNIQAIVLQLWRLFGFTPHYLPLGWRKKDGFETKLDKITTLVDRLSRDGNVVSLIGVSAGASAVLSAYAARPKQIAKVILICGKVQNPQTVGRKRYQKNPDFKESLRRVGPLLETLKLSQREDILSISPWHDKTVPPADTVIQAAHHKTLPGLGHISGIGFAISFGLPVIARFLRKPSTKYNG